MKRWWIVVAWLGLAACEPSKTEAEQRAEYEKQARAWCEKMGIRPTGIDCQYYLCAVASPGSKPFTLACGVYGDRCVLHEGK